MSSQIQKGESAQPTSTHFNPLCSFYFFLMLMSTEIQKSESQLRWVEVDVNPTVHFIVSIFVFMLMLNEIQKSRSGLRWVEVNPKPTSIHFVVSIFVLMLMSSQIKKNENGLRWVEVHFNPRQSTW